MRRESILFRLTAGTAFAGLSASFIPLSARAQVGPSADEASPPPRVGALTRASGTVSFHPADADSWSPAAVNYPVTTGEGFWTQPGAEARIDISDTDLVMAGGTELEVSALDEQAFVATLPQGEAYLRVRDLQPGQTYTLVTPRGAVTIGTPGRYDIVAGDTETPTQVAVLDGAVTLTEGAAGEVPAGQGVEITGGEAPFQAQLVPAAHDPFIDHVLAEERPARSSAVPPPPLVAEMPGGADLAEYGAWSQSPQYGQVWYPEVQSGWVPYRQGHWAYVAPWGWTWVDDDPWGFAPFHYGRWVDIGGRWAWTPGARQAVAEGPAYPVYAPALVTFFGVGAAVGVTAALLSSGSVGWVPLGPGEVYRPWFRAGPGYVRDVNIRHVTNLTQITSITNTTTINRITVNQFRNAAGATVVPAAAMAMSRPLAGVARAPTPQVLAAARPVFGRPPLPPTTATAGVTPAVARAVHAVPPPAGTVLPPARVAPGPAIRAQGPPPARPGGPPGLPTGTVRPPGGSPPVHASTAPSAAAAAPQAGVGARPAGAPASIRPGTIVPPLRQPGAAPPAHPVQPEAAPALSGVGHVPAGRVPTPTSGEMPHVQSGVPGHAPPPAQPMPRAVPMPAVHPTTPSVQSHPAPSPARPVAAPAPALHPAPAAPAFHPAPAPAARVVHPPPTPAVPVSHPAPTPAAPVFHPPPTPAAPVFHPAPAPAAPAFHPPPTPAAPVFHPAPAPAAPVFHPPPTPAAPAFHPAPAAPPARPAPHPAPHEEKRPGQP